MKILLINRGESYSSSQIETEAEAAGHEIKTASYDDINISFDSQPAKDKNFQIATPDNTPFSEFDAIIPRGPLDYRHILQMIGFYCRQHQIFLLNHDSLEKYPIFDKSIQHSLLAMSDLPIIPTILDKPGYSYQDLSQLLSDPVIYKYTKGFAGKHVYKINSDNDRKRVDNFDEVIGQRYFIAQKFWPSGFDLRIIVIGNKVIGGMKRMAGDSDEFRNNYSLGGQVEAYAADEDIKNLSVKAAQACDCDYAGVDVIFHEEKPYILEVNRYCHFEGFDRANNTSVAKEIIDYIAKEL